MELCTTTRSAISYLPSGNHSHRFFVTTHPSILRTKSALSLKQNPVFRSGYGLRSRILYYTNPLTRATTSEETSSGPYQYVGDKQDVAVTVEEVSEVETVSYNEIVPTEIPKEESPVALDGQAFELLEKLNIKFDSEDTYSILLYGGGALLGLWLASAVVGAIDSIPLIPKLMEIVGLGYTFWFAYRFLLFKENREEFLAKIDALKQEVIGTDD